MELEWGRADALVLSARDIVVVTHVAPDGDAIGTLLGLGYALRRLGKHVTLVVDGRAPAEFLFLPGAATIGETLDNARTDLVIAVDCGDEPRMGSVGAQALATGAPVINLDHHVTNTQFGTVNLVVTAAVAAAEIVYDWLPRLGVLPDYEIAVCLLTGLVTDTLCFRTNNVTSPVLAKAQRLMEAGASLHDIVQQTVDRKSLATLRLWAVVMPTMHMEKDGIIWAVIDRAARARAGFTEDRDGGLVSLLISVDEANVAIVFREKDDGRIEIGFRAVSGYDVSRVAVALGGGGHALASGCTTDGPLEAVISRTLGLLRNSMLEGTAVVP